MDHTIDDILGSMLYGSVQLKQHFEAVAAGAMPSPNNIQVVLNHMSAKNQELVSVLSEMASKQQQASAPNGATVQ